MKFKYIGILQQEYISFGFNNSIFVSEEEEKYYTAQVNNFNEITNFILFDVRLSEIFKCSNELKVVTLSDQYIFSFIGPNKELFFGTKKEISPRLFYLLNNSKINNQCKLLVSNFLNLYENTLDLLENVNNEFKLLGFNEPVSKNTIFKNKNKINEVKEHKLLSSFESKIETYEKYDVKLKDGDIIFFDSDKAYFEDECFEANQIILELKDSEFKTKLDKSIISSSDHDTIDIDKVKDNKETFEYFLYSSEILFKQKNIEKHLSSLVKLNGNYTKSIIDSGFEMDKFYEQKEYLDKDSFNFSVSEMTNDEKLIELESSKATILSKFKFTNL